MSEQPDEVPSEWRFALGGQLETAPHGVLDVGWRRGPLSVQLLTDTLDLRLARTFQRGKVEAGLRAATFAAGMWIDPWLDGAPDRSRGHRVAYVGPDLRLERWLPYGGYLAASGWARWHVFTPLPDATVEVPDQGWLHLDAVVGGWWQEGAFQAKVFTGIDQTTEGLTAGQLGFELVARPRGPVAPIGEWRAVLAQDQDDIVATRVGGMTPYHVPLAGASWAEFWVEDLVAARTGLVFRSGSGPGMITVGALFDAAAWTWPARSLAEHEGNRDAAAGVAAMSRIEKDGLYGEVSVGRATVARPDGIFPVSFWLVAGSHWQRLGGKNK